MTTDEISSTILQGLSSHQKSGKSDIKVSSYSRSTITKTMTVF